MNSAKLYFFYGAMGASKSANILTVWFNYESRGMKALLIKSPVDTRDPGEIKSRNGLSAPCILIDDLDSIDIGKYNCVAIDEAQFLTREQVEKLAKIVYEYGIPVMCYGLRTDFKGDLFTGSAALFALADSISEIKTVCWCGRKAIFNARYDKDGNVIKTGDQIVVGADDQYESLCRKHWIEGDLGPINRHGGKTAC